METPNHQWRFIAGKIIYFYGPSIPWRTVSLPEANSPSMMGSPFCCFTLSEIQLQLMRCCCSFLSCSCSWKTAEGNATKTGEFHQANLWLCLGLFLMKLMIPCWLNANLKRQPVTTSLLTSWNPWRWRKWVLIQEMMLSIDNVLMETLWLVGRAKRIES